MFACATLAILSLTLLPSLSATIVAPMQSPPTFVNWAAWQAYIVKVPTPQAGCFEANYPNPVWQQVQCGPVSYQPHSVGNGNDWVAQVGGGSGKLLTYVIGSLGSTGLQSEKDVKSNGPNVYSLQINSNFGFPVTYYGKKTTGWEQFLFDNQGTTTSVGPPYGSILIEYWLLSYHKDYGKCPPASQNPPGGGSGWLRSGDDCFFNTNGPSFTPDVPATNLYLLTFSAEAHVASKDSVGLCIFLGKCYSYSVTATVLSLWKQWKQSEFNVFGICCSTQAVFNSGTTITVTQLLEDHLGVAFGTASCKSGGTTGETNNLNLGSCSTGDTWIDFTESN